MECSRILCLGDWRKLYLELDRSGAFGMSGLMENRLPTGELSCAAFSVSSCDNKISSSAGLFIFSGSLLGGGCCLGIGVESGVPDDHSSNRKAVLFPLLND